MDNGNGYLARARTNFGQVRSGQIALPRFYDVDLSTARSIAAKTALQLPMSGNFLYIDQKKNSGIATIHLEDVTPGSLGLTVFPGAAFLVPFTQIALENDAQPGLTLRMVYGTDVSFSPSNTAGVSVLNSVSIVDGGKARTASGLAFFGTVGLGAVAAQYPTGILLNPAASGKNCWLKTLSISASLGVQIAVDYNNTPGTASTNVISKKDGTTAGVTQVRYDISAGGWAAGKVNSLLSHILAAGVPYERTFSEPVLLTPGMGVAVRFLLVNVTGLVNYEVIEEPV